MLHKALPIDLRDSLQFRVTLALALFVAVVITLVIIALFTINSRLETGLLNGIVRHEMHELRSKYPTEGRDAIPSSASIISFVIDPSALDTLPSPWRELPPDEPGTNIHFHGHTYRVSTAVIDGERAYLAYDITAIVGHERLFRLVLIGAGFIVFALAVPLGMWIARISLQPINSLAEHVGNLQPGDRTPALASRFDHYEVGVIARAFDRFMGRLDEFVERERSFTTDASHELRTPLAVIQGALEVLQQDNRLSGSAPLTRIDRAARQMAELIDTLLFLARDESPASSGGPRYSRADGVVSEVIEAHRPLMTNSRVDIAALEPCVVQAPHVALVIVFGNLLRNALRHGGPTVTVRLADGLLSVTDSGQGMSSEQLRRAFERGFKSGSDAGLGLGLYLVKRVADRYGWPIELTSRPGEGTRIELRLIHH